ncbi:MAG TPA: TetR/AcrR family transcriptional regulator [Acidimicrobiia bacterium]|jgi:AcrR family transcriptional regulator
MVATARRREEPAVRREQILDAAERTLVERGLATATMADVAVAAGVAKGTVYLYYDSKDELLAALRARYLNRFASSVAAELDPGRTTSATVALERCLAALFDFSAGNHRLHHVLFHEAGFSEEDALGGIREMVGALVADGVARGEFRVADPQLTTTFLLHGLHGALVTEMHQPVPDRERFVSGAIAVARATLGVQQ